MCGGTILKIKLIDVNPSSWRCSLLFPLEYLPDRPCEFRPPHTASQSTAHFMKRPHFITLSLFSVNCLRHHIQNQCLVFSKGVSYAFSKIKCAAFAIKYVHMYRCLCQYAIWIGMCVCSYHWRYTEFIWEHIAYPSRNPFFRLCYSEVLNYWLNVY